jgi:hypothetical protein
VEPDYSPSGRLFGVELDQSPSGRLFGVKPHESPSGRFLIFGDLSCKVIYTLSVSSLGFKARLGPKWGFRGGSPRKKKLTQKMYLFFLDLHVGK